MKTDPNNPILRVLKGERVTPVPVWFMRQAGRHLPEYMKIRATAQDFIDFCFSPDKAAEVTLQPVRRYDMDAAILFADILLIPIGLGRRVEFVKGVGPTLDPIDAAGIDALTVDGAADRVSNVYETVRKVRAELDPSKALIGFCGGPWTVATYMLEGRGTPNKEAAKRFAYEQPDAMAALLDALVISSADYLIAQAKAGADVLKIFESWAEGLSPDLFDRLVLRPTSDIISRVRAAGIDVPIMGFPRGAGLNAVRYAHDTGINAIAAGTDAPLGDFRATLPEGMPVQGNLDPLALRTGGAPLMRAVDQVLRDGSEGPHIFNLGHGVTPDVAIEDVHAVIRRIREFNYD
ncbi:uroporphyrinogen decarboxylase [Algimonas ampicilliniresistens]|uniref:Uroporphyrinogen decarboxylase n=1 Tax=Algimonas ampicilliniresistens TaxID=1298735 RepID=A0ABQ5VBA6_9PROT|nr:uroporphyrinogen decarboxylase [Algimonas ampicilliniresistens]GLQ24098.1 uroporphyrinogen decarboxylase [Algimonas ampicilliniresistens]